MTQSVMRINPALSRNVPTSRHLDELGLASAVAHEVRRLLTPAKAYAELALASPLSSEASQAVLAILKASQECEDVLEALVASGGSKAFSNADVAAVACQVDAESLQLDVATGLHVSMSPARLLVVLSNLVANGLRASRSTGTVSISAERSSTGNTILIRVTDCGIGMSPGQLNQATKAFISFASSSGIGLAICQHLIEEAGGRMWIASAEGKGTCVSLELPAATMELKKSA